jgi:uncharacterized protein YfaS (alpha-2-macroglobulin family)
MSEALRALVREPNGCFEQTSSVSYPMVMAQQYFLTHAGDPDVIEKAKTFLDTAYRRLIGFEAPGGGFEWFGEDPGHEALTAYGLLQFTDMSQVRSVDKIMLKRVREWLLSRRDGKGGYLRGDEGHSFGASRETATAYITWALVEAGESGLEKEVAAARALANSTSDSYIVALAANILHLTGDRAGARLLMDKLAAAQDKTGMVKGAVTSITQSGGASLQVETTALGVLAWTRAGEAAHVQNVENGVRWIAESNKDGRFGSTQATILALRAVIAHDAADRRVRAPGRAILIVDGKPVGAPLSFSADAGNAIVLPAFGAELGPGKHTVTLQMEDGFSMPFSMSVRYHGALAVSDEQAQVGIQVALRDSVIQEGGVTEAVISIANRSDKAAPTPLAIVGIPGGLEVRHDHLKDLVKSGRIDAWEIRGREVVLYWRSLAANAKFDLPLSLVAAVPGAYTGPASRAYLYYTDEFKTWVPGVQVRITPR